MTRTATSSRKSEARSLDHAARAVQPPHGIAVDAKGNVYVADRSNHRLQVLDNDLNPKAVYDNIGDSWTVCISPGPHQYLFSSNSNPNGERSRLLGYHG